jgi:hypothetical protein
MELELLLLGLLEQALAIANKSLEVTKNGYISLHGRKNWAFSFI